MTEDIESLEARRQLLELRSLEIERGISDHDQWYCAQLVSEGETRQVRKLASRVLEKAQRQVG